MGSLFVMVFQGEYSITVGASGAIFGLLGALVYFGYNYRGYIGNQILKQVVPVIAINLFIGFTSSNISNAGHIGGLLGGFVVAFMLGINDDKEEKSKRITGSILTVVLTGFMIYLAFFR
jgi:rhomboid protease GluP